MNKEKLCQHLSGMIKIPTVTYFDREKEDEEIFESFADYLRVTYPLIHQKASFSKVGKRGLLYCLRGGEKSCVLMAHYDVVPANEDDWSFKPFSGTIDNSYVYGRGTIDTKSSLCCTMEAVESALKEGKKLVYTIYLAFSGEEEVEGESSNDMMKALKEKGIHPEFVLDEGGAVIPEGLPGVPERAAMIGIAEKGVVNIKMSVKGKEGHASTPPKHTAAGALSAAVTKIENHPFKSRLTPATRAMFSIIGRKRGGVVGLLFKNAKILKPGISFLAGKMGGTFNAMMRTTTAVTMLEASPSYNILPSEASAGINLRLLYGDTKKSAIEYMQKIVNNPDIQFEIVSGSDPSPVSEITGESWQILTDTIDQTWPGILTAPYTLNGGTDSRFWHTICSHVYKFTPMQMDASVRATVHGIDEKIKIDHLIEMASFYEHLIDKLSE